jgi:hypothetical protein
MIKKKNNSIVWPIKKQRFCLRTGPNLF